MSHPLMCKCEKPVSITLLGGSFQRSGASRSSFFTVTFRFKTRLGLMVHLYVSVSPDPTEEAGAGTGLGCAQHLNKDPAGICAPPVRAVHVCLCASLCVCVCQGKSFELQGESSLMAAVNCKCDVTLLSLTSELVDVTIIRRVSQRRRRKHFLPPARTVKTQRERGYTHTHTGVRPHTHCTLQSFLTDV